MLDIDEAYPDEDWLFAFGGLVMLGDGLVFEPDTESEEE